MLHSAHCNITYCRGNLIRAEKLDWRRCFSQKFSIAGASFSNLISIAFAFAADWKHPPVSRSQSGSTHSGTPSRIGVSPHSRSMSASFVSNLPPVKDIGIAKALSGLLGHGWLKLEPQVKSAVESAISGGSDDPEGKETLIDAWRAAQAVESFGGLLTEMLLEINDLCGDSGEVILTVYILSI